MNTFYFRLLKDKEEKMITGLPSQGVQSNLQHHVQVYVQLYFTGIYLYSICVQVYICTGIYVYLYKYMYIKVCGFAGIFTSKLVFGYWYVHPYVQLSVWVYIFIFELKIRESTTNSKVVVIIIIFFLVSYKLQT